MPLFNIELENQEKIIDENCFEMLANDDINKCTLFVSNIRLNIEKKNDDINTSSIAEDQKCCSSPKKANKKKVKRAFGSIQINNMQFKERILKNMDKNIDNKEDNKEDNENEEGRVEIQSDKESLISILSDLM